MSFHHSPYLQGSSDLIFSVDAANPKCKTGSTFDNLLGTDTGTLNTAIISGDTLELNGSSWVFYDDRSIPLGNVFTIISWFNLDATASTSNNVIYGPTANGHDNWLAVARNGTGRFFFTESSDTNNTTIQTTSTFSDGVWYQVAATMSGSTAEVFVNGVSENSTTVGFTIGGWSSFAAIGRRGGLAQNYFTGEIGPIFIYDAVKSESFIKNNYEMFKGRYT